jgi:hypothetical protein
MPGLIKETTMMGGLLGKRNLGLKNKRCIVHFKVS